MDEILQWAISQMDKALIKLWVKYLRANKCIERGETKREKEVYYHCDPICNK